MRGHTVRPYALSGEPATQRTHTHTHTCSIAETLINPKLKQQNVGSVIMRTGFGGRILIEEHEHNEP